MKDKGAIIRCLIIVFSIFAFGSFVRAEDAATLNLMIKGQGKRWVAGETSMSRLSREEQTRRLGLRRHKSNPGGTVLTIPARSVALPASLDWRNNGGRTGSTGSGALRDM